MIQVSCHQCGTVFCAQRKTAKFCDPACRKAHSRGETPDNLKRPQRRDNIELLGYHYDLAATYYALPPTERVVWLRNLIERARKGDTAVKRVLTNAALLRPREYQLSKAATYSERLPTLAQEAHALCKFMWDAGIAYVIDNPELPTHAERVEKDRKRLHEDHRKLFSRCLKKLPELQHRADHTVKATLAAIVTAGRGPVISEEHRARWGLV